MTDETATRLTEIGVAGARIEEGSGMSNGSRGGNGRMLAKLLDVFAFPLAVLDRKGQIIYLNGAFCHMAKVDSSHLVGQTCSWKAAADGPYSAVLTALAPPEGALEGRIVLRQLTVPILFGATETGQAFIPLSDRDGVVDITLVLLGDFDQIKKMLPNDRNWGFELTSADRILVQIRSRWKMLDSLTALLGNSASIQQALDRVQLSIMQPCHTFICGPSGVGKLECAQGIFLGRMKSAGQPKSKGQFFPVDCRVLDGELIDEVLDIFSNRLSSELPLVSQQLVFIGIDHLSISNVQRVDRWVEKFRHQCLITTTSSLSASELVSRSTPWDRIIHRLSAIEISLPGLFQRREDIPVLALNSLAESCEKMERAQLTFAPQTLERLVAFPWPGNTRQLREAIEHAVGQAVLTGHILPEHLPLALQTHPSAIHSGKARPTKPIKLDVVLRDVERALISQAIELSPRNRAGAARLLGISRPRLLRRIEQLGIAGKINTENSEPSDRLDINEIER